MNALWGWPPPVLDPAGPYADSVTVLAWALFGLGVLVTGVVVLALWVAISGPEKWKAQLGGEKIIWIGGIAFPAVVLTILLIWGLSLTASLTRPISGDEMRIRVTGEMWWFRVAYLSDNGEVILRDANEIHIPAGKPVVLELESADVIHNFWVPNLSGKMDMIPGRTNLLRIEADRPGRFGGVCAEYCGGPHALMGFVTIAHEPEEFGDWMAQRRATSEAANCAGTDCAEKGELNFVDPLPEESTQLDRGESLFMESGCAACHRVAGTRANGLAGPDLTHVGSRVTLGAGILPNHRGTMMGWIGDSQSIKPGNRMPSYNVLSSDEIEAIAVWLEQRK